MKPFVNITLKELWDKAKPAGLITEMVSDSELLQKNFKNDIEKTCAVSIKIWKSSSTQLIYRFFQSS